MPGKVTEDHSTAADARDASQPATRRRRPERLFAAADAPDDPDVRRLHTTAMLADLLGVPPVAVRHWIRTGLLVPTRRSGTLDWFDFGQLVAGRSLARLLAAGLSLREIDAKLTALAPAGAAEVARAGTVVADGRRLSVRRGDRLLGAGGQMQLAFYAEGLADVAGRVAAEPAEPVVDMAAHRWVEIEVEPAARPDRAAAADVGEILDLADDLEAAGEFVEAAEAVRAVLQAQGPTAPVAFMLAELVTTPRSNSTPTTCRRGRASPACLRSWVITSWRWRRWRGCCGRSRPMPTPTGTWPGCSPTWAAIPRRDTIWRRFWNWPPTARGPKSPGRGWRRLRPRPDSHAFVRPL